MEPSLLAGAGLAVLVFGFLAFQDRVISMLADARSSEHEELLDWQ